MKGAAIYGGVAALAAALFWFFPQIDLTTSGLFYAPGRGFFLGGWPPGVLLFHAIRWIAWGIVVVIAFAGGWLYLLGRPVWRFDRKALLFVAISTAIGPGLLANTVLKDHWGRARPVQIEAFGGSHQFTAAPLISSQCAHNCSFVSGHAALAFSLVAFAFLLSPGRPRRLGIAAALGFGALVGLDRIAEGGHFLSDVVYAGLLVYGVALALHWWIVTGDGLASPPLRHLYRTGTQAAAMAWPAVPRGFALVQVRIAVGTAAAAILVLISIDAADLPLAWYFHARGPDLHALFDLSGRLGLSWGYLTIFGLGFVALHWGGELPRLRPFAAPMRAYSAVPAFLFASLAASGLIADLLKIVFGRARPKLLFAAGVHGFTWFGWNADRWSFPSGHTTTIVALMMALWLLWPRHLLFYVVVAVLVAGSRVVVGAHYLSDTIAGAWVGVVVTGAVASLFASGGIDLAAARRGRVLPGLPPWPCRRARGFAARGRIDPP